MKKITVLFLAFAFLAISVTPSSAKDVNYNKWSKFANFPCKSGQHCIVPLPSPRHANNHPVRAWKVRFQTGQARGISNVRVTADGRQVYSGRPKMDDTFRINGAPKKLEVWVQGGNGKMGVLISAAN